MGNSLTSSKNVKKGQSVWKAMINRERNKGTAANPEVVPAFCQSVHSALSYLDLVTLSTTYKLGSVIVTSLQMRQRRNKVTKQPRSAVGSNPHGLGLRVHAPNQRASRPPLPRDAR